MAVSIRPAHTGDGPLLQQIEREAGEQFRDIGMPEIADDDPPSVERLADYAASGRSWVAIDDEGLAVGYVLCRRVGEDAHVEQVSVRPRCQGQGIGHALMDQVRAWAISNGCPGITLTTFADVPWNAPWYERLGYRALDDGELSDELRALRAEEAAHGLDLERRVCMRLELQLGLHPDRAAPTPGGGLPPS